MIITYTRSSSLNNFEFCQQQYFLTYNLGYYRPSMKKADQGSAVHKCLEQLAIAKQYIQDNPTCTEILIDDMVFDREEFLSETVLTNDEVDFINKSRKNKQVYLCDHTIKYGHKRYGVNIVNTLIKKACDYYSTKSSEPWSKISFTECNNFAWIVLDYKNGIYDPRRRNIKFPEKHFNIEIDKDWARYEYESPSGEKLVGQFGIKGTVDLITELSSDTLEIVDWKTGQRKNWATGEVKTYDKLCDDTQLMMYYYAISKMYPQYKHIFVTIFFVRDGGPFTIGFEPSNMDVVEERLRQHFEEVRGTTHPTMCSEDQSDFKCTRLCNYYKEKHPTSGLNICKHIHNETKLIGIDNVVEKYKRPDFHVGHYESPGE